MDTIWSVIVNQLEQCSQKVEKTCSEKVPRLGSNKTDCKGVSLVDGKYVARGGVNLRLYRGDSYEMAVKARKEYEEEAVKYGVRLRDRGYK